MLIWTILNAVPVVYTIAYIGQAFGAPDNFLKTVSIEERSRRRGGADLWTWVFAAMVLYGAAMLGWHAAGGALLGFLPDLWLGDGLYASVAGIGAVFGVGVLMFAEKYPARHLSAEAERVVGRALLSAIMGQTSAEGRDRAIAALDELIARQDAKTWDANILTTFVRDHARDVRGGLDVGRARQ